MGDGERETYNEVIRGGRGPNNGRRRERNLQWSDKVRKRTQELEMMTETNNEGIRGRKWTKEWEKQQWIDNEKGNQLGGDKRRKRKQQHGEGEKPTMIGKIRYNHHLSTPTQQFSINNHRCVRTMRNWVIIGYEKSGHFIRLVIRFSHPNLLLIIDLGNWWNRLSSGIIDCYLAKVDIFSGDTEFSIVGNAFT